VAIRTPNGNKSVGPANPDQREIIQVAPGLSFPETSSHPRRCRDLRPEGSPTPRDGEPTEHDGRSDSPLGLSGRTWAPVLAPRRRNRQDGSGGAPRVQMVQPTNQRELDHASPLRWLRSLRLRGVAHPAKVVAPDAATRPAASSLGNARTARPTGGTGRRGVHDPHWPGALLPKFRAVVQRLRGSPRVPVVQTTDDWKLDHLAGLGRLHRARLGRAQRYLMTEPRSCSSCSAVLRNTVPYQRVYSVRTW
jgi:hypothetical protein